MQPDALARHPALRPYVRSLRYYDISGFPAGEHIGMPSAAVTLVLPLDPPLDLSMPDGPRRVMRSCLAGMHDGPATIHHDGTQRGIQLALSPLGLDRLVGLPAGAVARRAVELGDVLGDRVTNTLLDRIAGAAHWPTRLDLVADLLLRRLERADHRGSTRAEIEHAWSVLAQSGGTARIADLAREVGWSTRHLSQQFAAAIGATPKTTARIVRFERSAALVARGHDLAAVAARCRFADQPHMTREWTRLAGTTPARWGRDDVLANVQDGSGGSGRHSDHDRRN